MPVEDGVGYGEVTPLKIEHLAKIFEMHLLVTQAVLDKVPSWSQTYRYIDLTSGKGLSPDKKISGSPLVFLNQAETPKFHKAYQADFIEQSKGNLQELKANVIELCKSKGFKCNRINYHLANYEHLLPKLLPTKNEKELGLIFVDPSGNSPDFDILKHASKVRPRMEILIYLSSTNIKRDYQNTEKLLSDYMKDIGKKHWLSLYRRDAKSVGSDAAHR